MTKQYKDLFIQEIQYAKDEGSEANVKQFMVYFREGNRLLAAEFVPTRASYDEMMSMIDTFLPVIEGAID